jgi:hypothetical protein
VQRRGHTSTAKASIAALAIVIVLVLAFIAGYRALKRSFGQDETVALSSPEANLSTADASSAWHPSFLFGRVTTHDNSVYEGRLQFGGDEEAFWGQYFNASKADNPWANHVPAGQLTEHVPVEILGFKINWKTQVNLSRLFMARLGDVARVESNGWDLQLTLKSGTQIELDLFAADDFADGVRVWDARRGIVDLEERQIRSIDFLAATDEPGAVPDRLHGTVSTSGAGDFSGFIEWGPKQSVSSDELNGDTANGGRSLRFDRVRAIAQHSADSWLVTLLDGEEIVLSETRDHSGIYVDDQRYGRVLIPWRTVKRVEFDSGGSGPAYDEFPAGSPLSGEVTTRNGGRRRGRLVYDLDESESTETLDAPSRGVDYNIPFGLVASIVLPAPEERGAARATVTLTSGEILQLELTGDLGGQNLGMLVFDAGGSKPDYVRWNDIVQIQFDPPSTMYPLLRKK